MGFLSSNLRRCALTTLLAGALAGSASAQSSDQIIFSTPVDDGIKSPTADIGSTPTANTVVPPHDLAPSFFDPSANLPRLAPPTSTYLPKSANKGSWVFMTPEQIMGVQTPEQMLGLEKNEDRYLTPEQRFMKRQQDAKLTMATNGASSLSLLRDDSNIFGRRDENSPFFRPGQSMDANSSGSPSGDSSKDFTRYLNNAEHTVFTPNQKFTGRPAGAFATPAASAPKVNLEQVAEMERFRALIGSSPQPAAAASSSFQTPAFKPESPEKTDIFGRPLANSSSGLKQPSGLTTLPSINGVSEATTPAPKKTWWQPQPAPWLNVGQPSTLPSGPQARKFY